MDHTEGGDALDSRGTHTGGALEALVKPKPSLSAAKPDTSTKSRKAEVCRQGVLGSVASAS